MNTLKEILQQGKQILGEVKIETGDLDAWLLLSFSFKINRSQYYLKQNELVSEELCEIYLELIKKRSKHIPLQYLTKEQEFMGLSFELSNDVLIPRQDTEILVEEILKVSCGKTVLDLCTGSGCILISLDKLGSIEQGLGVDLSEKALDIAKKNAALLDAKVDFIQSDLYQNVIGTFDIIVSNPPYIPTNEIKELMEEVRVHEPLLALDGKEDGLFFYREITKNLHHYLNPGGYVFFEIGYNQGMEVSHMLQEIGMDEICVRQDFAGLDRVVCGKRKFV